MGKYVYMFEEGSGDKDRFGGKGAGLCEMTRIGIPVPPGFVIITDGCALYESSGKKIPDAIKTEVIACMGKLEKKLGRKFGDPSKPLLVSVRSGAKFSMPGMMDTILNLGLNDTCVEGLAKETGNPRFAYDSYRRLLQMYGDVVMGLKPETQEEIDPFEKVMEEFKKERGYKHDLDLNAEDLKELTQRFKGLIKSKLGKEFPQDPMEQLMGAIGAVFQSWWNKRAYEYRRLQGIPHTLGTAVNVQAMVFGNMGEDSGTGVAFTRDPATGKNVFYGEYLMNAQGEDVVAGIRTPMPISKLAEEFPEIYEQLLDVRKKLERHFKDMQDIEFTIQNKKLWILQTRSGKRTGLAAIQIAVDMVNEGILKKDEALLRIEPSQLNQLLRPIFDPEEKRRAEKEGRLIAKGLNAGPGAASGRVYFTPDSAEEAAKRGEKVILARIETSPEDIRGMALAEGILTARGGMTSHAALVARQMGKVCVVGCEGVEIDYQQKKLTASGKTLREGEMISLDGTLGEVYEGEIRTRDSEVISVLIKKDMSPEKAESYKLFKTVIDWANEFRRLGVRANADKPDQASAAIAFGAEGIGLCRTEHMFFEGDRINAMREMIMADTPEKRRRALDKLLPMQREDFEGLFTVMNGRPVTIRTLDPPLHEFLPHIDNRQAIEEMSRILGVSVSQVEEKIRELHEANPMLGFRGCRLGISYPEITEMQARAIFEAACNIQKKGIKVDLEIMIPLVSELREFRGQKEIVDRVATEVFREKGITVPYRVGTMIEVPRAALTADEIAAEAEFFSFGTNDLTQMTLAVSRDDAERFLPKYVQKEIFPEDPFISIDETGVGKLMKIGIELGRKTRKNLKVGICGEHGGDPKSVIFCHNIGLDYVSCSPYRVPIAIVAAAHAVLLQKKGKGKRTERDK